jgi:hypothetical protein
VSNSANADWDETIYRISRIPGEFDLPHLSHELNNLFELEDNEIRIHSLADDATDEPEPSSKLATASFRARPTHLQSAEKQDEWLFEVNLDSKILNGHHRIYLDRHFNGFIPLSPAGSSDNYTIECALFPRPQIII